MRTRRRAVELFLALCAFSCAGPPRRAPVSADIATRAQQPQQAVAPSPEPTTPDAATFVLLLVREPDRIASSLDMDFVHLLDRAQDEAPSATREELALRVRSLFADLPAQCDLGVRVDSGYTSVALPPPMEGQSQEQVALIESAIRGLQAGQEVAAFCRANRVDSKVPREGSASTDDLWLFAVNVSLQSGQWRLRAWRSFRADEASLLVLRQDILYTFTPRHR